MRFVAIDFESANSKMTSICQAGIVVFDNEREDISESILIDPQDYFDSRNIGIHGIEEHQVIGHQTFPEAYIRIEELLRGEVVVCHTAYDRTALFQACNLHGLQLPDCRWLDSARVARRAWSEFSKSGYGLFNLAKAFSIDLKHHDALEDARASGRILLKAISDSGMDLEGWFDRVEKTVSGETSYPENIRMEGGGDGPLAGEVCVFTGQLQISRREAAEIANKAGSAVHPNVTRKTTLVVVGDQDLKLLAGKQKSSKHLKAEELATKGLPIRIVQESDFMALFET